MVSRTSTTSQEARLRRRFALLGLVVFVSVSVGLGTYSLGLMPLFVRGFQEPQHAPTNDELKQRLAALGDLGYLSGYEPAPEKTGVLVHDVSLAYDGYNLYTSGHSPEATLMDMNGKVLHRWRLPFYESWPELDPAHRDPPEGNADYWRRNYLFENGDLLAIFDGLAMMKLDRQSNLIWAYRGGFHHDLEVTDDGRIFVLTHRETAGHPRLPNRDRILEDFVTELNADGLLVRHVSILEALARSDYASLLDRVRVPSNIFHTNTLEVLEGRLAERSEAFAAGNVLVSLREIDVVAVLNLETETVVWTTTGDWKMQHQPTMLDNGHMLLFDNQGHNGVSKVLEFDPLTQERIWAYEGNEENGFYSAELGSSARLPNDNTLITESFAGRAFEVTRDGTVVWEFVDSKRIGPAGEFQLIPTMCEMLRIEKDYVESWLASSRRSP